MTPDTQMALALEWIREHARPLTAQERGHMAAIEEAVAAYDLAQVGARTGRASQRAGEELASVDALAQLIRVGDGDHSLGAGALAELLWPHYAALQADLARLTAEHADIERMQRDKIGELRLQLREAVGLLREIRGLVLSIAGTAFDGDLPAKRPDGLAARIDAVIGGQDHAA